LSCSSAQEEPALQRSARITIERGRHWADPVMRR